VAYFSEPEYKFQVDRSAYYPKPAVNGAVVEFRLRSTASRPPVPSEKGFLLMVGSPNSTLQAPLGLQH
jgi:16S rRNA A1518/A1519 N6-dimethyltransferase RsmA/KsgA/DIM1 with predicted DNA glycosylase/AP lyase activity